MDWLEPEIFTWNWNRKNHRKPNGTKPTHVLLGFKMCEFSRAGPIAIVINGVTVKKKNVLNGRK